MPAQEWVIVSAPLIIPSFVLASLKLLILQFLKKVLFKIVCFEMIEVGISLYIQVEYITTEILPTPFFFSLIILGLGSTTNKTG